jgi:hypothetical protein
MFYTWLIAIMTVSKKIKTEERLKHQLGYKWSLFHKTVLESVSRGISDMPIDIQISNLYLMGIKEGRRRHDCRRCRSHML